MEWKLTERTGYFNALYQYLCHSVILQFSFLKLNMRYLIAIHSYNNIKCTCINWVNHLFTCVVPITTIMDAAPEQLLHITSRKWTTADCICKIADLLCSAACKHCVGTAYENSPLPDINENDTDDESPSSSSCTKCAWGRRVNGPRQRWRLWRGRCGIPNELQDLCSLMHTCHYRIY